MFRLLGSAFATVASLASLLGLYFTLMPAANERPWWHLPLILFAVALSLGLIIAETMEYGTKAPKTFQTPAKINEYMRAWLNSGGRSLIFSRDMSWAQEPKTRAILVKKAQQGELVLCVEHEMPLAMELGAAGATIVTYGELNHVPRSRFTIVDFGKEGARVAVGAHLAGHHVIQEFQSGHHPFFAVAEDLATILIKYHGLKNAVQAS